MVGNISVKYKQVYISECAAGSDGGLAVVMSVRYMVGSYFSAVKRLEFIGGGDFLCGFCEIGLSLYYRSFKYSIFTRRVQLLAGDDNSVNGGCRAENAV